MTTPIYECVINKKTITKPIWLMRQAGRYLPEFKKIRKINSDFVNLCLNNDLSSEITLQPLKRFDLDAAIIFSDILMIPYGLGQKVKFKKGLGPILGNIDLNNIINIEKEDFVEKLLPVYKGIEKVKENLKEKSLIGFVGAPWTLLLYMLNKESPKNNFNFKEINKDKYLINKLLKKIEEMICLHVDKQIEAGADIISTNTFNSNTPSQSDYGTESLVAELNLTAANLARQVADEYSKATGSPRFVAGILGPTNRTCSISPDINNPSARNTSFDNLAETYSDSHL